MAEGSGSTGILGVIVGAAIVVALGLFLLGGNPFGSSKSIDVNIQAPAAASK